MAVSIVSRSGFEFKAPRPAAPGQYVRHGRDTPYDVAPDGRLLLLKPVGVARDEIVTVLNWVEELKRLVPTKRLRQWPRVRPDRPHRNRSRTAPQFY
jgi:hypothetical protein